MFAFSGEKGFRLALCFPWRMTWPKVTATLIDIQPSPLSFAFAVVGVTSPKNSTEFQLKFKDFVHFVATFYSFYWRVKIYRGKTIKVKLNLWSPMLLGFSG